jgi:hypothetical protein
MCFGIILMSQLTRGKGRGRGRHTNINKQKELVGGKIQWKDIRIKEVLGGKIQFHEFILLDAKQWVHKIIANELDLQPSYQNTLGMNNVDIAQGKINL